MAEILAVLKNHVSLTLYIGLLLAMCVVAIFSEQIKGLVKKLFGHKRTILQSILTLGVGCGFVLLFDAREKVGCPAVITYVAIAGGMMLILWLFTYLKTPWFAVYYRKYARLCQQSFAMENFAKVKKKPWFVFTTKDNFYYALLYERYCLELNRSADVCETLKRCQRSPLIQAERRKIDSALARTYWGLGSFQTARDILEHIDKPSITERSILGVIYEEGGEMQKANEILARLKEDVEKNNYKENELASFYNNYGRRSLLCNNYSEAILFFKKSATLAKEKDDIHVLNCAYTNLVMCLLRNGDDREAKKYYQEYLQIFANRKIGKQQYLELLNFRLTHARQVGKLQEVEELFKELRGKQQDFTQEEKLVFWIASLHISCDHRMDLHWILTDLTKDVDTLLSLPPKSRYRCCKELWITFQKIRLPANSLFLPLRSKVFQYMHTHAEADLSKIKESLPIYAVRANADIVQEENSLKSEVLRSYSYADVKKKLGELVDIYNKNGLAFSAFTAKLNMINMAYLPQNVKGFSLQGIPNTPYDAELKTLFGEIYVESKKFETHPGMPMVYIQLSTYALNFDEIEKAKEMLDRFEEMKISDKHFYDRLQDQIEWVRNMIGEKECV